MNTISRRLAVSMVAFALSVVSFASPAPASAICAMPSADMYKSAYDSGGYAFLGTVTNVQLRSRTVKDGMYNDDYLVTASVERVWGVSNIASSVTFEDSVVSPVPGSAPLEDEGIPFSVGTREIILVSNNAGVFSSNEGGCSFNRSLSQWAAVDLFAKDMKSVGVSEGTVLPTFGVATVPTTPIVPPTPASQACPAITRSLSRGMRDGAGSSEIRGLQLFLALRYGLNQSDAVTGYFGSLTQKNVMRFQAESSLPQVGVVGPLTRGAYAAACANSALTQV